MKRRTRQSQLIRTHIIQSEVFLIFPIGHGILTCLVNENTRETENNSSKLLDKETVVKTVIFVCVLYSKMRFVTSVSQSSVALLTFAQEVVYKWG